MSVHHLQVRIYYEDTDFSGFVYHAAYLKFFERGRTEFLRDLGVHHAELAEQGIAFAVRRMQIDFEAAARIDDLLSVETAVEGGSGARLVLNQTIRRGDTVLTRARVEVAAVRIGGGATRLPKNLLERLRS
ncbi:tol-pal system-associated acyl-CoA thioesterase [Devosia albogilva]|uniref:Tol-pal system-associated acyl-CoA thioesterase n=1 Tax=Devosia albogilva TaxID=429726 RepID=A0ABW5QHW7_9HYPH